MTQKTLTELQDRLRYGDSNNSHHDGVKPQLVLDILDSYVHLDNDGVAELAVLDDVTATAAEINKLDDSAAVLTQGSGISSAETYASGVFQNGDIITTRIVIDLTGLVGSATDLDVIGNTGGAANAHIGQITAALNGTIVGGKVTCLEAPAGGSTDIDIYSSTAGTGAQDADASALAGAAALLTSGGAWASGTTKGFTAVPAADSYLYLANGAASGGTFTAGKFVIEFYGV